MYQPTKEASLPATLRERLQRNIDSRGHVTVMRAVGLAPSAFWRAVAGAAVRAGTVHQIEAALGALERDR